MEKVGRVEVGKQSCLMKINKIIQSNQFMHYQFLNRVLQKSSSVSIKLPQIEKQVKYQKNNKNNLKMHDYSLQTISINEKHKDKKQLILRSSSITQRVARYAQQKLKSRIKRFKHKTQNADGLQGENSNPEGQRNIVDNTLTNFKKYVEENREHIHEEINKRMHESNVVCKTDKNIAIYKQKPNRRKSKLLNRKNSCTETEVFDDIQKIINKTSATACTIDLNEIEQKIKIADLKKNLKKMSPQKSIQQIKATIMNDSQNFNHKSSKVVLKNQNNYHEWRRVNISSSEVTPHYCKSTLQIENQRLNKLALQTEASICRYLQTKKHLLQLKLTPYKTSL